MLRSIQLTNFRRHRDAKFTFQPGHNVIRGLNEGGKTTIAEGMAYALFGSEALRDSLADVVTWGEKDTTLRVVVDLEIGGTPYRFSRGKSGAECSWGEKMLITGQKEVTKHAAALLGADYKLASKLMIASQKGLQGALAEGPKATSEMIEGMADFDLFERLTQAMTEKLVLGAPLQFEQRLAAAQVKLDDCPVPTEADVSALEAEIVTKTADRAAKLAFAEGEGLAQAEATRRAVTVAETAAQALKVAAENLADASALRTKHRLALDAAQMGAQSGVTDAQIDEQRARVAAAKNHAAVSAAHRAVTDLMATYPATSWDEPLSTLEDEIAEAEQSVAGNRAEVHRLQSAMALAESQKVTGSVCGFCNQDVSQFPDVAAKNAALTAQTHGFREDLSTAALCLKMDESDLLAYRGILKAAVPFQRAALTYAAYVEVDESNVPPRLTWKGPVPNGDTDERTESQRLSALETAKRNSEAAAADVRALERALAEDDATISRLAAQLAELPEVERLGGLKAEAQQAEDSLTLARYWVSELALQIERHRGEINAARTEYENRLKQRARLTAERDACKAQLDELGRNNALLAKIRKARPIISDKLWNTVLHAVSTMFTGMRGEPSVVSKDKDGFKVNGKPVTSLSGSTIDLLALAIRVAMIKTFLPHCPFLSLDEPFSACDEGRTANMLGFITTAGFQQTLVITHEDASEAVAENLVTV